MKKLLLVPALALLFTTACEKENTTDPAVTDQPTRVEAQHPLVPIPPPAGGTTVEDRASNKVTLCHRTGNGQYHAIEVNQNAVAAHLAHGDYLPDGDGDGYTAVGACTGSQNDCDDSNAAVHPGAEEVCDDGLDNNCDGQIDEGCCSTEGLLTVELPDGALLYVHPVNNGSGKIWGGYPNIINIDAVPDKSTVVDANSDFDGQANTAAIVAQLGPGNYAAKICDDLVYNGCDDWYLPSAGELNAMFEQLGPGGNNNFSSDFYWSSTEQDGEAAWCKSFTDGWQPSDILKGSGFYVRCVRR